MWSLPDIARLNSRATDSRVALHNAVETGFLNGEALECEHEDENCTDELRRYLWYDIFSDDPKGVLTLCERHDGYFGSPTEGYFTCDSCQRIMPENYTWELYYVHDEATGESLCLPCAAERYIAHEENWIELTPENIEGVDFKRVRQAKHVIGVKMPVPKSIEAYGNGITLDSSSGGMVRGFSSADSTPDAGVRELRDELTAAMEEGHKRALLILDGGFQFAVSIGAYVRVKSELVM
jgi:hypothetical protein